jgi:hypothetical protein
MFDEGKVFWGVSFGAGHIRMIAGPQQNIIAFL